MHTRRSVYRLRVSSLYHVSECTSPGTRSTARPRTEMMARDQDSAVGEEVCSGCVEATRERGRLFFADFGSATALFPLSAVRDFEAERDLIWASVNCCRRITHAFPVS